MGRKITSGLGFIKRQSKVIIGLVAGLVVGAVGVRVAMAAIPDTAGVIHACYRSGGLLQSGQVRIIDSPGQSCNGNETAVSWNSATPGQFLTNLVGADLTNAALSYRNFVGADLHGGTFTGATMNGADLTNANLSSAIVGTSGVPSSVVMRKANLTNANFSSSNFSSTSIDFNNANLTNTNFSNTRWVQVYVTGGNFQQVNFTNVNFGGSTTFDGSDLTGVDFRALESIFGAIFNGSNLSNANFSGLYINLQLVGSNMTGANFTNAHFENANLQSDFSGAVLTGATWTNTICPDGTNSDANGNTCLGHLVP